MRVATSGDGTVALASAAKYVPDADLRAAWGKLFRVMAWAAAVPSFGLLLWSVAEYRSIPAPTDRQTLAFFLQDYVAACGVGLTALFASISLPRTRSRALVILFGGCFAGLLVLYLPSLLNAWPLLREHRIPRPALLAFLFPFGMCFIAGIAATLGRRRRVPASLLPPSTER